MKLLGGCLLSALLPFLGISILNTETLEFSPKGTFAFILILGLYYTTVSIIEATKKEGKNDRT